MPIYEYECHACGHEFEEMQKITDRPIRKCKECGKMQVKKKMSRTTFVLKGSGWYVTDYNGKKTADAEAKKSTESKDSSDAKEKTSTAAKDSTPQAPQKAASA